jgi:murein DD-endopeptidase MepM/ murein hydrolase activator NlpD
MKYEFGFGRRGCFDLKPAHVALMAFSVLSAGCSADVTRFDSSSFSLNDPPATASTAPPPPPVRSASDYDNPVSRSSPRGPYGAGAKGVEMAALPDATPPSPPPATTPAPPARGYRPMAAASPVPAPTAVASGETIEVAPGDTLYGLSRKHHVSLAELMAANQLTTPALKPGQKLVLPVPGQASAAAVPAQPRAPRQAAAPAAAPMTPPSADVAAKYSAAYTVKPGDSLYSISRKNKISLVELEQVNNISDPRKVRPGTVLKVPAGFAGAAAQAEATVAPPAPAATPEPSHAIASSTQPTSILNGNKVAARNDQANDAQPAATPAAPAPETAKVAAAAPQAAAQAGDSTKLRWPVSGKIIAGFGGRTDGTHNDGVNMSVPLGTEVHAAESGVVAYSGSELKGYGNLVLIRHDNGWVTAYAHNDELMVKRGDKVSRGQVIAKAGKTGTVDQPQVHFELRQGSKPVDPTPFMEKN